jgi:hypothetical protein
MQRESKKRFRKEEPELKIDQEESKEPLPTQDI